MATSNPGNADTFQSVIYQGEPALQSSTGDYLGIVFDTNSDSDERPLLLIAGTQQNPEDGSGPITLVCQILDSGSVSCTDESSRSVFEIGNSVFYFAAPGITSMEPVALNAVCASSLPQLPS